MASPEQQKSTLHERNLHRGRYDFTALVSSYPDLAQFVSLNKYGDESIDFANPQAVKALNKALLQHFYKIEFWDIPEGYLCPPIPGRADYLHNAADLLASVNNQEIPTGAKVKVLDVGVGANCVYPIIGHQTYGWNFVGSEIDKLAVNCAKNIVEINSSLRKSIDIRLQPFKTTIFKNIIKSGEKFDITICNPPFHASAEEALLGSQRKVKNLGNKNYTEPTLNFGGMHQELWTTGGEIGFVGNMIAESKTYHDQCLWFTTLISKSENLPAVQAMLKRIGAVDFRVANMATGNKITRIVAWTFLTVKEQEVWRKRWI